MDFNSIKDGILGKVEEVVGGNVEGLAETAKEKFGSVIPGEQVDGVVENVKEKLSDTLGGLFNGDSQE